MRRIALLMAIIATAGSLAATAAADPANGFVIHLSCDNGQTVDAVSIPQAHNDAFQVVGSTSVVVLVGLTAYDLDGNLVASFLRPGHENQQLTECNFVAPGFGYGTAEVLYTPVAT